MKGLDDVSSIYPGDLSVVGQRKGVVHKGGPHIGVGLVQLRMVEG